LNYIQPKKLRWDFIRNKAEEFRKKYVKLPDKIPVPIIEIVELQLRIAPVPIPNLLKSIDVDGFLSNDLNFIYIDQDIYFDERFVNRLRFTFAHEVGHYVLHKEEIQQCMFRTEEEWLRFREDMLEDELFQFEQQAYEFAGRLLVPLNRLNEEINNLKDKIDQFRSFYKDNYDELLKESISRMVCGKFGVSEGVILRRIRNEDCRKVFDFFCKNLLILQGW
jgi:Zn-dependent peptidase ImmA (M78 family)